MASKVEQHKTGSPAQPTLTVEQWRKLPARGTGTRRKEQPETPIRRDIRDFLRLHGWKVTRIVQSALSEPGIPDLVCTREGQTCWIEVKRPGGRLSEAQEQWLQDLEDHGGHFIVARSVDDVAHLCRG